MDTQTTYRQRIFMLLYLEQLGPLHEWAADWYDRLSTGDDAEWEAFKAQITEAQQALSEINARLVEWAAATTIRTQQALAAFGLRDVSQLSDAPDPDRRDTVEQSQ